MNEQIKEIARSISPEAWRQLDHPDDIEWCRKFAEALIQEICTLIKPDEEWRRDASWGYIGGEEGVELLDGAISTIKGHFGVKS
jgi:hypothetical protein